MEYYCKKPKQNYACLLKIKKNLKNEKHCDSLSSKLNKKEKLAKLNIRNLNMDGMGKKLKMKTLKKKISKNNSR